MASPVVSLRILLLLVLIPAIPAFIGKWHSWSSWSSCQPHKTTAPRCGAGTSTRTRSCSGWLCSSWKKKTSNWKQTKSCTKCCPVDCAWKSWGAWCVCSKTCGSGVQYRTRGVSRHASCGGKACVGASKETRTCNTQCCRSDCRWSRWCDWSSCTKSCGGGVQVRTRHVSTAASCGGSDCTGSPLEEKPCNLQECPPETINKITCEHKTMSLSCPAPKLINVVSASYGRKDSTTCKDPRIKTTNCHASSSLTKVKAACQGKSSCDVKASNGVFSDPCVHTFKYLNVTITCN